MPESLMISGNLSSSRPSCKSVKIGVPSGIGITGEKARTLTYWFTADEKGNVTFDKSSGKDLEHKGKVLQAPEPEIF